MTGYLININNDCNQCVECTEVCQTGILTEDFINMVKSKINSTESPDKILFRKYAPECTYCESCESVCGQEAIWIINLNPECEELQ